MTETRPEFSFIQWLEQQQKPRADLSLGIGDDTAILGVSELEWLVTKDVLIEGTHFTLDSDLELIGRKAINVNISDIAAMGGLPKFAFVGLVLPKKFQHDQLELLYQGMTKSAEKFGVVIAGGDTNSADGPLMISVTLIGQAQPARAIRRDGAQPGDQIFVTGPLGGSLASGRHLSFTPRVNEAQQLLSVVNVHAMLDLSDGLASDLHHILRKSQCGAVIEADKLPIHTDVDQCLSTECRLQHALSDGEDFELLFTVSAEDAEILESSTPAGLALSRIGEITESKDVFLKRGDNLEPFPQGGWSHSFGS